MRPAVLAVLIAVLVCCSGPHDRVGDTEIPDNIGRTDFILPNPTGAYNNAFIYQPSSHASGKPWVMYSPTLPGLPAGSLEVDFYFAQWLAVGIAQAGVDAGEFYGAPRGLAAMSRLYDAMVAAGFSPTPLLFCRSRGGLMSYNWAAENPTRVSGIAGIFPVADMASYPGLASAALQFAWQMNQAQLTAAQPSIDPINRLAPIAAANVPIYLVHGDTDMTVPIEENSQIVHDRYIDLGGSITLEIIPGKGHDSDPAFFDNQALANFVIQNAK